MADAHTLVEKDVAFQFLQAERRRAYTTPKSFLELINLYLKLLTEKQGDIEKQIEKLKSGTDTLLATENAVSNLKAKLEIDKIAVNQAK